VGYNRAHEPFAGGVAMKWWIAVLAAGTALCQRPSFGFKAGVPASDAFRSQSWRAWRYHADSGRYVLGPAFELRLPLRLSAGLDFLHRSVKYRWEGEGFNQATSGNAWYFPVWLKYRLTDGWVAPYLAGGLALERLSGLKQVGTIVSGTLPRQESPFQTDRPDELVRRSAYGYLLGFGLEGRLPGFRLAPELRYTRWQQDTFVSAPTGGPVSNRNQVEVLLGIMF